MKNFLLLVLFAIIAYSLVFGPLYLLVTQPIWVSAPVVITALGIAAAIFFLYLRGALQQAAQRVLEALAIIFAVLIVGGIVWQAQEAVAWVFERVPIETVGLVGLVGFAAFVAFCLFVEARGPSSPEVKN